MRDLIISMVALLSCSNLGIRGYHQSEGDLLEESLLDALQTEIFAEEFKVCSIDCGSINLFDYGDQLPERVLLGTEVCEKSVDVYNTASMDHPAPNSIVMYRVEETNENSLRLYFMRPYSGAAVNFYYSLDAGQIKLIEYNIGSF